MIHFSTEVAQCAHAKAISAWISAIIRKRGFDGLSVHDHHRSTKIDSERNSRRRHSLYYSATNPGQKCDEGPQSPLAVYYCCSSHISRSERLYSANYISLNILAHLFRLLLLLVCCGCSFLCPLI